MHTPNVDKADVWGGGVKKLNPRTTPSGRKVTQGERKKKEKKAVNSEHLVPCSERTPLGPNSKAQRYRPVCVCGGMLPGWSVKS